MASKQRKVPLELFTAEAAEITTIINVDIKIYLKVFFFDICVTSQI